jgi:hypothetical protein
MELTPPGTPVFYRTFQEHASGRDAALYLVRIEDLGRGDFVKVHCAACRHVALLTPDLLLRLGVSAPRRRCSVFTGACGAAGVERKGEPVVSVKSSR